MQYGRGPHICSSMWSAISPSQVRWWASLRGQTLGRTLFGLMEMREALVDVVFLELKALHGFAFKDVDYHMPNPRSSYEDILAWMQRNRCPAAGDEGGR